MSRQVNFFSAPSDAMELHAWLLREFPELSVIPTDRGLPHELRPVTAAEALQGRHTMYLVPAGAAGRVVLYPLDGGRFVVDIDESPVIEYSPSLLTNEACTLLVGRLYWRFSGELSQEEQRKVDRMFRWVRSHTSPIPPDKRFRIFPHAAQNCRTLDYGLGIKEPNPFLPY
jgi:hypothetical protein